MAVVATIIKALVEATIRVEVSVLANLWHAWGASVSLQILVLVLLCWELPAASNG